MNRTAPLAVRAYRLSEIVPGCGYDQPGDNRVH